MPLAFPRQPLFCHNSSSLVWSQRRMANSHGQPASRRPIPAANQRQPRISCVYRISTVLLTDNIPSVIIQLWPEEEYLA